MPDDRWSIGPDDADPGWQAVEPGTGGGGRIGGSWSVWFLLLVVALIAWGALSTPTADGKPYREPPACGRDWPPTCDQEHGRR